MKPVAILLASLFYTVHTFAVDINGWKYGISLDNKANVKSSASFEVDSPRLFGEMRAYSLILSLSSQTLNARDGNGDYLSVLPVRIMMESRNSLYKDIVSSYIRLGVGWTFASDKLIHTNKGYFILPFMMGIDIFHTEFYDQTYGSFFIQVSDDFNFVKSSDGFARDLNGTTLSGGVRIFY